ncbi:MAG: phage tail protein [Caldilineaceae bacterium]
MSSSGLPIGYSFATLLANRFGQRRLDPYQSFNFVVEIEGLLVGGFTQVGGLEGEVGVDTHEEGGVNDFVHSFPGRASYSNLILTHGLTDISTLWNWYYNVTQGIVERKNGTIMLLDRQQYPVMYWNFRNAFPVKWTGPTFDASSSDAAVESIELVHEGLVKPLLGQLGSLGRGVAQLAGWQG